jgi:hypothetical protein
MSAEASGHTHLNATQQYTLTKHVFQGHGSQSPMTLEEVNEFARGFLEYLQPNGHDVFPSAIVISTPSSSGSDTMVKL